MYDAQTISAEYLIEDIDLAFKSMERWPCGRSYAFEDFCKYVLPYRIGDEAPDRWRSVYCDRFSSVLDSLFAGTDVVQAVSCLQGYLRDNYPFEYSNRYRSQALAVSSSWSIHTVLAGKRRRW